MSYIYQIHPAAMNSLFRTRFPLIFLMCILLPETSIAQEQLQLRSRYEDSASIRKKINMANSLMHDKGLQSDSLADLFYSALEYSRQYNYRYGVVHATIGLGYYYTLKGEHDFAIGLLKDAYQQANSKEKVQIENNLATIYTAKGAYSQAMHHYLNALKVYYHYRPALSAGMIYHNIAEIMIKLDRQKEALPYLDWAEKEAMVDKDPLSLGIIAITKGNIYYALNKTDSSDQSLEQAIKIARNAHLETIEARARVGLAQNRIRTGDYTAALKYLAEAEPVESLSRQGSVLLYSGRGRAMKGIGAYREAEQWLLKSEQEAKQYAPTHLPDIYQALYEINKTTGRNARALGYLERYIKLKDSISGNPVYERIRKLEQEYDKIKLENENSKQQLFIQHQQAVIRKKNYQHMLLVSGVALLGIFGIIFYKYRQRTQQHKSQLLVWRASMDGEENERNRLARELHDNIGGSLATVQSWLGTIIKEHKNPEAEKDLEEVTALVGQTLREVRNTAHHLMPELLLRYGLAEAIRIYCHNIEKASRIRIEYQYFGYIGPMEKGIELLVYRTVQELVHNIIKHSRADFALVQLTRHGALLSITVEDNGIGMDPDENKTQGFGLAQMKRNIENLKGHCNITSDPGKGVNVYIEINIDESLVKYPAGIKNGI